MREIIIVTPHLGNGGAERVLSELISSWAEKKYSITVLLTDPKRYGDEYQVSKNIHRIELKKYKHFRRSRQAYQLVKILRKNSDAIVVSFVNSAILICGLASLFSKNTFLFSERCDPEHSPEKKIQRFVRDNIFKMADYCVFQTSQAKAHFSKKVQQKSIVIPNPINPRLPEPLSFEKKEKIIISASQLTSQKNIPMLINAFELFNQKYPDYVLKIFGRGDKEADIKQLIISKGLQDKAILMGFSSDIYNEMNKCSMFISSSNYEGISNSMLEAMSLGLPTIATDCPAGGARETIIDRNNGILVEVGDYYGLYLAMVEIAENPKFASELSNNAIKIRNMLSIDIISNKWINVFERVGV